MEQQNTIDNKLQEPINFTDPYVLHDVQMTKPAIVHLYQQTDMHADQNEGGNNNEVSTIKTHGILYPLVQVNTKVIEYTQIIYLAIYYDNFLPTIKLIIRDPGNLTQRTDLPGLNNTLKVVIVPEVENIYKTIAINFKILSTTTEDEEITYTGICHIPEFNKIRTKELIYQGCNNEKTKENPENGEKTETVKCNPDQNTRPNTWEMLHIIANECQLGFCSTDKCQDIQDRLPRLIYSESYSNFILDQLDFSGLDENSVFDVWVDIYGYLVMVNLSWLLNNDKVTPNNLGIYAFTGLHGTDDMNEEDQEAVLVHRTLTNYTKTGIQNNLAFQKFEFIINNNDLLLGTSVSMYNFGLLDVSGGNNAINQYDVEVVRDSIDDQKMEEYAVQYQKNLIIECNDLAINKQMLIRDKFFSKHRQRLLKIEMVKPNLGLQRGILVNVLIVEEDERNKQYVMSQTSNVLETTPKNMQDLTDQDLIPDSIMNNSSSNNESDSQLSDKDCILDEGIEVPNFALSGIYYIDAIKFEYSYEENEIKQSLLLIKKSNLTNLSNLSTPTKIDTVVGSDMKEQFEKNEQEKFESQQKANNEEMLSQSSPISSEC